MNCKNHPDTRAAGRCSGCAETFCRNCLVDIKGQKYCASCKVMALQGQAGVVPEEATLPCREADEALKYGIVSLLCFGFILGPLAIKKALAAKKMIEANPRLTGSGKATAGMILGGIGFLFWILAMIARFNR